jgi:SAM-dependent methyltransferase
LCVVAVGEEYPQIHEVTGIDLSPIQPSFVPVNVRFAIDDFEDEWIFPDAHFDFVHMRHTLHSVRDTPTLLSRAFRHVKPGGYVEFQELYHWPHCDDGTMDPQTPYLVRDWLFAMQRGMHALGSDLHAILALPDQLRKAGFEDVHVVTIKCPMGPWARDRRLRLSGLFLRMALMDGLRGLSHRPLSTGLGWREVQIEVFLAEVRKAVMAPLPHTYWPYHFVYARKPA